jgi:hypothetical protein
MDKNYPSVYLIVEILRRPKVGRLNYLSCGV